MIALVTDPKRRGKKEADTINDPKSQAQKHRS